jgi:hypothetical protein
MQNLLVMVDRTLEANNALETACYLEPHVRIQPIHVSPPQEHNIAMGAGWARISWGKETMKKARRDLQDLLLSKGHQCPHINDPIVVSGDSVKTVMNRFQEGDYDMIITGAPFRGLDALGLAHRFRDAMKKPAKDLPLLIVSHLGTVHKTLALTDGQDPSARALGLLNRIGPLLSEGITLIGIAGKHVTRHVPESLILEQGLAILKEKDIDAAGHTAESLGDDGIREQISQADLLVCPLTSEACTDVYVRFGQEVKAVLFFIAAH